MKKCGMRCSGTQKWCLKMMIKSMGLRSVNKRWRRTRRVVKRRKLNQVRLSSKQTSKRLRRGRCTNFSLGHRILKCCLRMKESMKLHCLPKNVLSAKIKIKVISRFLSSILSSNSTGKTSWRKIGTQSMDRRLAIRKK